MHKNENNEELVDYQLNFPFNLTSKFKDRPDICVENYCYLVFPELMFFSRPLNHQMVFVHK